MEEIGTVKDVAYIVMLVLSVGSVYWKNEIDKVKLRSRVDNIEKENKGQGEKLDTLLKSIENLSRLVAKHIAYHKGKEDR